MSDNHEREDVVRRVGGGVHLDGAPLRTAFQRALWPDCYSIGATGNQSHLPAQSRPLQRQMDSDIPPAVPCGSRCLPVGFYMKHRIFRQYHLGLYNRKILHLNFNFSSRACFDEHESENLVVGSPHNSLAEYVLYSIESMNPISIKLPNWEFCDHALNSKFLEEMLYNEVLRGAWCQRRLRLSRASRVEVHGSHSA